MLRAVVCIVFASFAGPAKSQVADSFSDGTFIDNPTWIGDTDRWQIGRLRGSPALQSHGAAASDTIHLSLKTGAAFGTWEFVFAHAGVNLSTFNGTRVFLTADAANPDSAVVGYYLQAGTNNTDALSLWRIDGDHSRRRELARSAEDWIEGDSSFLRIKVDRDQASRWTVRVNDRIVMEALDARYTNGRYFIIWVKHNPIGAGAFFLDDVAVMPESRPVRSPPGPRDVVINEVQFNPLPGGAEFVELYHRGSTVLDLQDLTIRDSRSPPLELVDTSLEFQPGSYAVITADADAFTSQFRDVPFLAPSRWASLNNSGDAVILEAAGVVVDSLSYTAQANVPGFSLERTDPEAPSDAYNFLPSANPFGATPGERNSVYAPDHAGPMLLFAEQINDRVLALTFNEPLEPTTLSASDVRLGSTTASEIQMVAPTRVHVSFEGDVTIPTVDVFGVMDRRGNVSTSLSAEVAFRPGPGDLVLNEIMYEPSADMYDGIPDQAEYVEILNRSRRTVSLAGLYRTRDPDEYGNADTLYIGLMLTSIEPDAMFLVFSDTTDAFSPNSTPGTTAPLNLRNDGDRIRLHGTSGAVLDDMRYEPTWHHPDVLVRRGLSLERIDPGGPSDDPNNWSSSVAPDGGTPGAPNSVRLNPSSSISAAGISVTPNPLSPDRDGHEDAAAISFRLQAEISLVRVRIFDLSGHMVRELIRSDLAGREGTVYWDGLDDLGRPLPIGVYVILVEATDREKRMVEAYKAPVVLGRRL